MACSSFLSSAHATPQEESPYAATLMMGRVLAQVENSYVEPVERTRLVNGAIKGMVEELDPHSSFLPPQEFTVFQDDTEGKFGGVGVEVDARADAITVIAPIEGSPAERAGVKSGDQVIAVDGESVIGAALDKMVKKMRGAPGSHVKLTVRRAGQREPITFDLVREVIHVPSIEQKLLDGGVAYVRIKQFQDHTHEELLKAAGRLRARAGSAPIGGVVLDMRSNPGGLVDEASEVADEFLSTGGIYTTRHRGQVVDDVRARSGGAFADVPIVILVNEWSASASELVAGALQDNKRAMVIGANTFGKGSVQSIIELPNGAGLRLTTARYYTPSGHSIQADGIHPDVLVDAAHATGFPLIREKDLEGHLPPEGISPAEKIKADAGNGLAMPDGGDLEPADARRMPRDPTKGNDYALTLVWKMLREKLMGHGPLVK
jgi:carboxyl-terminal processing protease